MSETDDTDVLLLIPPDFFSVHSSGSDDSLLESSRTVVRKPPSCTAHVLGKLVNQVHSLENRLESLELSSDTVSSRGAKHNTWDFSDSFRSGSADTKFYTFPRRRRRKNVSKREKLQDLSLTSLDSASTYAKIPPLSLHVDLLATDNIRPAESCVNESPSMDGDISSIVSTPSKKNDKLLLHEIDEFLTKVETYESPDSKFRTETSLNSDTLIRAAGDYLSNKLDIKSDSEDVKLPSGRIVPSSVLDKYIYLVRNNALPTTHPEKTSTSDIYKTVPEKPTSHTNYRPQNTEQQSKPPDVTTKQTNDYSKSFHSSKSPRVRKLEFLDYNKDIQPTSTPKRLTQVSSANYSEKFKPSSSKIYDRASRVLEQYKSQNYEHKNQSSTIDTSYLMSPKKDEFKVPQSRPYQEINEKIKVGLSQNNKFLDTVDTELLSLSELWGDKKEGLERGESVKLEEERMKREHCESLIQELQKKLLDQQERLAVAVRVDRSKDQAISKLRDAWIKLTNSLDRAEERHKAALENMAREVENFRLGADEAQKKTNHFEAELYKALDLAHDYQEKSKQTATEKKDLQDQLEKALAHKDEVISGKDQEIDVLKDNYDTVTRLNKQSNECMKNLEDTLEKERQDHEHTRAKLSELSRQVQNTQDECSIMKQERDLLKEKVNEERARSNILERQAAERQRHHSELMKTCDAQENEIASLRSHLELQKTELKNHYQKQLEDAVLSKLREFQHQLEEAEGRLQDEARDKEAATVDALHKQRARIDEQHKLEINLLEEKQREEIKLYKLQLAQASQKIEFLEGKLDSYRRRRGQLASELHCVMEAQWRQALMILTGQQSASADHSRNNIVSTPEAQDYGPPKVPPLTMPSFSQRRLPHGPAKPHDRQLDSMFDFQQLSDTELQQYVKLLLKKPANFQEGGGGDATAAAALARAPDSMEEPTSDRAERRDRSKRNLNSSKPPWKA